MYMRYECVFLCMCVREPRVERNVEVNVYQVMVDGTKVIIVNC